MNKKDICEICGEELEYAFTHNEYKRLTCEFCNEEFTTNTYCPLGHYICDPCHSEKPIRIIEDFCKHTTIQDPFLIADTIMAHPNFKTYGPEHHVLVPAVLLTTLKNNGIQKPNEREIKFSDIKEGINRASKIPGGYCGFYGSCGAGMGAGVAISIFTDANPSTDIPRSLANKMTSRALAKIADDLEHCCKRSVRLAICEALNFMQKEFDINLDYSPQKCQFSGSNDKCAREKCFVFKID
jgi:hypothetical protein